MIVVVVVDVDFYVDDGFASRIHKETRVILPGGAAGDPRADRVCSSSFEL